MTDVTVVIPTHNRRDLLSRALRSVCRQRSVDIEVIVVDDGSTDGTPGMVRGLADERVRVIRHDVARGVSVARNSGVAAARGSWIALLDDDDLWAPDKLRRQLAAARASSSSWAYAGAVEIDEEGKLLGGDRPPSPQQFLAEMCRRNVMPAGASNVVVRADEIRAVNGFDPVLRHLADWDLWLRLAARSSPAAVDAPLVAYRQHSGQATLDVAGMSAEARLLAQRHGADPVSIYRWAAWSLLRQGRRGAAAAAYLRTAAAGDPVSLLRAAVAIGHPRPSAVRRPGSPRSDAGWLAEARRWLPATGGAGPAMADQPPGQPSLESGGFPP